MVIEQLCIIAMFLQIFVQGVVYVYALHPGCGASPFGVHLSRDGLRREIRTRLQHLQSRESLSPGQPPEPRQSLQFCYPLIIPQPASQRVGKGIRKLAVQGGYRLWE